MYDLENSLCALLKNVTMFIPRVVTWREWRGAGQRPGQTGYNLTRSPGPRLKNTCSQNLSWNEIDIQFQRKIQRCSLSCICVVGWLFLSQSIITTILYSMWIILELYYYACIHSENRNLPLIPSLSIKWLVHNILFMAFMLIVLVVMVSENQIIPCHKNHSDILINYRVGKLSFVHLWIYFKSWITYFLWFTFNPLQWL